MVAWSKRHIPRAKRTTLVWAPGRVGRVLLGLGLWAAALLSAIDVGAAPIIIRRGAAPDQFRATVADRQAGWHLVLRFGQDARPVEVKNWGRAATGGWQAEVPVDDGRATIQLSISRRGAWTAVDLTLANPGRRRAFWEIGWRAEWVADQPWFWGGWRTPRRGRKYEADRGGKVYPLAALYDGDGCVSIAYSPEQFLSYIRHQADCATTPASVETVARVVVDPGAKGTVRFLLGAFQGRWGYREALHWYYEAFPEWFWPRPDVDPRASLNGGSYLVWRNTPQCDLARRLMVGWDWCYAPFRRTGDIYGRPEFWNYKPVRKPAAWRDQSIDDFHRWRKKRFAAGDQCDVLMAFYVPAQVWCEERLARQRYADALTTDPKAKTYFDTPWVTGHDNDLRVFPLNTSFGRQSRLDMKAVIDELGLQAFAFDTAGGGARYYGPAAATCPGRAWDERGIFVEEAVAIGKLIDWVHQQRQGNRRLAVIINPGAYGSFMSTFRCDSSMLESAPTAVSSGLAQALRARLGHKTMVFWETFEYERWLRPDLSREQYIDALRGVAEWTVQACLRVVTLPTPRIAMGLTPLVRWLPVMRDMVLAGWEPVPAAFREDGEWVSRAGRGLGCYLATANGTAERKTLKLAVDDPWIGPGRYLWVPVGPRSGHLKVTHVYGSATSVAATVEPRQALVLKAIAYFEQVPVGVRAVTSGGGGVHERVITVHFGGRGKVRMVVGDMDDMVVDSVTADGRRVKLQAKRRGLKGAEMVLTGGTEVRIRYLSRSFQVPGRELQEFPGVHDGRPNFSVVVPAQAPQEIVWAARWISQYLRRYYKDAVEPPVDVEPAPIVRAGENVPTPRLVRLLVTGRVPEGTEWVIGSPQKGTIEVRGRTPEAVSQAVKKLLAVWDEKHVWAGPLPRLEMFRRVGLAGKQLPPQ